MKILADLYLKIIVLWWFLLLAFLIYMEFIGFFFFKFSWSSVGYLYFSLESVCEILSLLVILLNQGYWVLLHVCSDVYKIWILYTLSERFLKVNLLEHMKTLPCCWRNGQPLSLLISTYCGCKIMRGVICILCNMAYGFYYKK